VPKCPNVVWFDLGALPAQEITRGIMDSVVAFTGGGEQKDDVTLVVVKRIS
jgi:serine phosphatase RsbU (regulator of sigma subunit)